MAIDDHLRIAVVLGGRGFVGRWLVLRLLKLGKWLVRVADSAPSLQLDRSDFDYSHVSEAFSNGRASYFTFDVRDKSSIAKVIEGSSVVFYTDDIERCSDDLLICYTIIVQGAKNVINACRDCKVKRLVYKSTVDVVSEGSHDILNGNETLPYASDFENMWSDLKAQAEALVLFANDIDGLLTCVLRPCNIFGPGDKHFVPFLVSRAKSGWAKFFIGSDAVVSDFTYVENVAHALVLAEEALDSRMLNVSGKVFFITNLEPIKNWEFKSLILEGLGYRRPMIKLPAAIFSCIASLAKWINSKTNPRNPWNSISRYFVQLTSGTRTFNCSAAQKDLGYSPVVSLEEAVTITIESFSSLSNNMSSTRRQNFNEQSKVEKLLGNGKVAEILLWRDEKESFAYFVVLSLLYCWFLLNERTFISSAAKLLLLLSVILSAYGMLSSNLSGFSIPRISSSWFEISDMDLRNSVRAMAHIWNRLCHVTQSLAQGKDWILFFKDEEVWRRNGKGKGVLKKHSNSYKSLSINFTIH